MTADPSPGNAPVRQTIVASPRLDGVRVAVLNWRCPWQSVAGGAEEYAWRITRDLVRRGAHVTFYTSRERGQPRREERFGVRIERRGGKFSVYPATLLRLLIRRGHIDAAIDCMNGVPFFSPLVLPRRAPVVCVVHHVHDLQFRAYFPPLLARLGQLIEGPIASRVYHRSPTVTVSDSSRQALRTKLAWRSPITVIHNGAPPPSSRREPVSHPVPEQRPGETDGPGVLVLGRLVVQKRVTRIVEAAAHLRDEWPALRLHIVGRGPQSVPLLERAEHHDLADRVEMHGFLPEAEKNAVIAACRLHVTASEFEGWGLTVIEAAALGIPTVAYDVDGLRDSVRDGVTGWLVRDGETLGDVMGRALKELSDPVRAREIQHECRAWAAQFTWERTGREMAGLLRDAL